MTDNNTFTLGDFCGLLAIVFIVLKLCAQIHWSWLWVLSPLWLPFAVDAAMFVVIMAIVVIIAIMHLIYSLFIKLFR